MEIVSNLAEKGVRGDDEYYVRVSLETELFCFHYLLLQKYHRLVKSVDEEVNASIVMFAFLSLKEKKVN